MQRVAAVFFALLAALTLSASASAESPTETLAASYKRLLDDIQGQFAGKTRELAASYLNALSAIEQNLMRTGDLDGVMSARDEAKRFLAEKTVPSTPAPKTPGDVAKLQARYLENLKNINLEKNRQILALADRFAQHLDVAKRNLTQQGKIEDARAVNDLKAQVMSSPEVTTAANEVGRAQQAARAPGLAAGPDEEPAAVKPPPRRRPAEQYEGSWEQVSPKYVSLAGKVMQMPKLGHSGAAYDSKRKCCVVFGCGSFGGPRNDMWMYDPAAEKWTCLQQNNPDADGKTLPKGMFAGGSTSLGFCYDPEQDLYWLLEPESRGLWSYDPNTRAWRRSSFIPADTKYVGRFVGLGYHPGLRSLVSACGPFNPKTGRVSPGAEPPGAVIYGWQPSSAAMSNGFSSPDDNGCYLALGKVQDAKKAVLPVTWLFDPARGTWTELKPTQSPPARSHGNVVYHAGLKLWVLYGGFGYEEKDAMSDTWIFAPHLGTWLEIARDGNPPPCANGALWYDEDGEQIIFLGAARTEQQTWVLTVTAAEEARQDH